MFDFCDFNPSTESKETGTGITTTSKPKDVQKLINNKSELFFSENQVNVTEIKNKCQAAGGEYIELPNDDDNINKNYYCISKDTFKNNAENKYNYSYFKKDTGDLIDKGDYTDEEYKKQIKGQDKKKVSFNSGYRFFDLSFDYICKECDNLFNGKGVLTSTYDPNNKEYKISGCVNSTINLSKDGRIKDPELLVKDFYTIDENDHFVKYTKQEIDLDFLNEITEENEYQEFLKKNS